jgi:hypothetical protein
MADAEGQRIVDGRMAKRARDADRVQVIADKNPVESDNGVEFQ